MSDGTLAVDGIDSGLTQKFLAAGLIVMTVLCERKAFKPQYGIEHALLVEHGPSDLVRNDRTVYGQVETRRKRRTLTELDSAGGRRA
jgi:hypothetical protein